MSVTSSLITPPLYPAAKCQLLIGDHSITNHLPAQIRHFAFDMNFCDHVLASCKWTSTDDIDWDTLGWLYSSHSHHLHFTLKLVHRVLPTGKVLHRRNPLESPFCPACGEIESNEQFLYCIHQSRLPFRIKILSDLRRFADKAVTDPILLDILIEGVDTVLDKNSDFPLELFPPQNTISSATHNLLLGG